MEGGGVAKMEEAGHGIMFPYPVQSHINSMMQLAVRLVEEGEGFFVTFVNTDWVKERIGGGRMAELEQEYWPRLRFEEVEDGLPKGHGRFNESLEESVMAMVALSGRMADLVGRVAAMSDRPPPTFIVADAFYDWMQDVADRFGVPRVALHVAPAHVSLVNHFQPTLIEQGYIPVPASEKWRLAQNIVTCIHGLPPMKLHDLNSYFLVERSSDFLFQCFLRLFMRRTREAAWNLGNSLEELEATAVAAFRKEVPNFLPIGPIPLLLPSNNNKDKKKGSSSSDVVNSLCSLLPEESGACMDWLDAQPPSSVLYISFGSLVHLTPEDLARFVDGVQESGAPFLWVVRPDQTGGAFAGLLSDISSGRRSGLIVPWSPQLSVLRHPSVAAFLSHCGWNSLLESFCSAVPVLAAPANFYDQRINAHYLSEIWRFGVRLPEDATASIVASHIRSFLQPSSLATFRERLDKFKATATAAHSPPSGSSYRNFRRFVDDMRKRKGINRRCCVCACGHGSDDDSSARRREVKTETDRLGGGQPD